MNIIKCKASEFATQNLILVDGQFGLETDTRKLKLGNGSTPWNSLSYFTSGGSDFSTPITISYTTTIPLIRALTIITGKTLTSTDVFSIDSDSVEGGGAQIWLAGDGTNTPDFSAFDYQSGTYDNTSGIRNLITMEYLGGKSYISILNMTAV